MQMTMSMQVRISPARVVATQWVVLVLVRARVVVWLARLPERALVRSLVAQVLVPELVLVQVVVRLVRALPARLVAMLPTTATSVKSTSTPEHGKKSGKL